MLVDEQFAAELQAVQLQEEEQQEQLREQCRTQIRLRRIKRHVRHAPCTCTPEIFALQTNGCINAHNSTTVCDVTYHHRAYVWQLYIGGGTACEEKFGAAIAQDSAKPRIRSARINSPMVNMGTGGKKILLKYLLK
jgi:hypothetical protein